jgi:hypothetical protein
MSESRCEAVFLFGLRSQRNERSYINPKERRIEVAICLAVCKCAPLNFTESMPTRTTSMTIAMRSMAAAWPSILKELFPR